MGRLCIAAAGLVGILFFAGVAEADCKNGGPPVQEIALPGQPFGAVASADGCSIFVSLSHSGGGGIAIVKRTGDGLSVDGETATASALGGLTATHDGTLLIAANGSGVVFVDAGRALAHRQDAVLGSIEDGGKGAIYVAVTPDDSLLFVSDERSRGISVIDLAKARSNGFSRDAVLGTIPIGLGPVGLTVSRDGAALFATSEILSDPSLPRLCPGERSAAGLHHEGALVVIDVARVKHDPTNAVVAYVTAGCNPVRVALSSKGDRIFVTARGSDRLLVFDTVKLLTEHRLTPPLSVPVGRSPVGVAVTGDGNLVAVSNSARFENDKTRRQTVSIVDATKMEAGAGAVRGTIEVGSFPRDLSMMPDGHTLLVANARSQSLSVIDLTTAALQPAAQN